MVGFEIMLAWCSLVGWWWQLDSQTGLYLGPVGPEEHSGSFSWEVYKLTVAGLGVSLLAI
jgi:hypothetical protein